MVELDGGEVVGAGGAPVHDHHGYAALGGVPHEPEAGHHRQRRAQHQQGLRGRVERVHRGVAPLDPRLRDVLPEEHHVGLEHASARLAARHHEAGGVGELDVTVGPDLDVGVPVAPAGVQRGEAGVQRRAAGLRPAAEADHLGDPAVQRADGAGARGLVQAVDVLGDQQAQAPGGLEGRERPVARVGVRLPHPGPAQVRAGPVALLRVRTGHELREGHRHPRRGVRPAVVRDAGVGAHPGAGQRHERTFGQQVQSVRDGGRSRRRGHR